VLLGLVALLNARGIQESVRANVVMTVVELSGLLLVVVLGAVVLGRGDGDVGRVTEFPQGVPVASGVLAAALLAYYSFVGFETSANVAEEVRDVRRVYPRALFGALLVAGVVYVLVGLAAPSSSRRRSSPTPRARCWRSCRRPMPASPTGCSVRSPSSPSPTAPCSR
jgi:basic amino acid/polyamine antiporter, APA family